MCGIFAGTKAKAESKTQFMIFTDSNIKSVLKNYFGIWPLINVQGTSLLFTVLSEMILLVRISKAVTDCTLYNSSLNYFKMSLYRY